MTEEKVRSLAFWNDGKRAGLTICFENGDKIKPVISPFQWALINQEIAAYVSEQFRRATDRPASAPQAFLAPLHDPA